MQPELYTAAQGLVARQIQLDNITNNIANASTTGFREVTPFFRAFNEALEDGPANPLNHVANHQPVIAGIFQHTRQGAIKATGAQLDVAIEGDGYFRLETPNGPRYTRAGNFTLDNQGQMTSFNGYPVMDENNQPIVLDKTLPVNIGQNGAVSQDGVRKATLKLASFADKSGLAPEEDTLLVQTDVAAQEQPATGRTLAGHLESSNVNVAKQMVDMITMQRAYDANIRTIRTIDSNLNEAAIRGFGPR